MKRFKISISILFFILISLFTVACKGESAQIDILGVKNIECSYNLKEYDLLQGVTSSNGEQVTVSGEVSFGTPGEYAICYSCGDTKVHATVKIYGEPIVVKADDVTVAYEKALLGDAENEIEVKDTFGNVLTVEFIGFEEGVAYPHYDTPYTAKYLARDKVGNVKEFSRKVTAMNASLNFDDATVDLVDDQYTLDLSGATFVALYDESDNLCGNAYENEGKLYHLNSVGAILGVGTHSVTVLCNSGYDTISLTVTDDEPFVYEFDYADKNKGISNYIWGQGEEVVYPELINKKGTYQQFDVSYALYYQGDEITITSLPSDLGEYTYKAIVTRKDETITLENKFYVVSEKEKLNYSYSTFSNQFINDWMPFEDSGKSVEYAGAVQDDNGTTYNAIEFYNNSIQQRDKYRMLRFNTDTIEKIIQSGSVTITMDVLLKEEFEENVYIFAMLEGNGKWDCSLNEQWKVNAGTWTTVSFDLSACWLTPIANSPDFFTIDYYGDCTINWENFGLVIDPFVSLKYNQNDTRTEMSVYIANVRFGETSVTEEKVFYGLEGGVGDKVIVSANGLQATLDGIEEPLVNILLTENGVVKSVKNEATSSLAYPTIGEINGNVLTYKGKEYVALSNDGGAIINLGKAEMPAYGEIFEQYGCTCEYKLINLNSGMLEATLSPLDMSVFFTKPGGYNLQLIVTLNASKIYFDNFIYVKSEDDLISQLSYSGVELKYVGKVEINGEIKDSFKVERINGDVEAHRIIQLNAEYVNKMLDNGINTLTVGVRTDTRTGYQKIHRVSNGAPTLSGDNNTLIYGKDYLILTENSQYQEVELSIEESMRDQAFGFSIRMDGYIYINEPFAENNDEYYKDGNDYGLDDIY